VSHRILAHACLALPFCVLLSEPSPGAAPALPRPDVRVEARQFTAAAFEVFEVFDEESILRPKRAQLVRLTLTALSRRTGRKLPAELSGRCAKMADLSAKELRGLLADAYARLRPGWQLPAAELRDLVLRDVLAEIDPHAKLYLTRIEVAHTRTAGS
jgi:hypothetical protein